MPTNYVGVASGAASGAAAGTMVMPGIGTAIGALIGGAAGYFGGKQKAAPQANLRPVDVQEEQRRAIGGNLANFDSASTLSSKTNSFNQSEAARLLEQAIPGIGAIQKRMLAQVNSDLDSQSSLPRDVSDKVAQFAAEKGVSRGTSGNFNAFSLVKDFGFNLVDWQQASRARALNTLSTVYGMTPRVNVMSPMSSMVDPNTAIQVAGQNNHTQFNADQAGLNSQTAASNYNRSQLAGILQSVGTIAGAAYSGGGVQAKTGAAPTPKPSSGFGLGQTPSFMSNAAPSFSVPGR